MSQRGAKAVLSALVILLIAVVVIGTLAWRDSEKTAASLRTSQIEFCERGNTFRITEWQNWRGDADDAYYLWGQASDPEIKRRYWSQYQRKSAQARALVKYAQLTGAGEPGQPTVRCRDLVEKP